MQRLVTLSIETLKTVHKLGLIADDSFYYTTLMRYHHYFDYEISNIDFTITKDEYLKLNLPTTQPIPQKIKKRF